MPTFAHKSDSIKIFAFYSTFNNTWAFICVIPHIKEKNILSLTSTSTSQELGQYPAILTE